MWNFPTQQTKQQNVQDIVIDMKIGTKQINNQAKTSEK
jgi:hypothetical protein